MRRPVRTLQTEMKLYPWLSALPQCNLRPGRRPKCGHGAVGKRLGQEFGDDRVTFRIGMAIEGKVILLRVWYVTKARKNVDIGSAMASYDGAQLIVQLVGVVAFRPLSPRDYGRLRASRHQHSH